MSMLPRIRRTTLTLLTVALAGAVQVGATLPAQAVSDPKLVTKINTVMKDSRVQSAKSGVVVIDATSGDTLYSRYGTRAAMPASNTKILTAVSALHTLGPGYRFKTEVIRRGKLSNGTVTGRLYLKGYGDPTSRQSDYASLAQQVRRAGITTFTGQLIADASFFDAQRYNPGWSTSYASDYYAAEISALTVAPNADLDSGTVFVNYTPAKAGQRAKITTTPAAAASYVKIVNQTTTSARGTSTTIGVRRSYGSNTITVSGRIAAGRGTGSQQITVSKPELYAAAVFRAELKKAGVTVRGSTALGTTPATSRHRVGLDTSITLGSLLVPFMKLSNNMHAEALTKTMGQSKGKPGNWKDGLGRTTAYLKSLGVPMQGVTLTDGSGLTRRNKVTPLAMATVLQKVRKETWFATFRASLPVAGNPNRMVGGTLRYRMTGTKAANNARAKTGSLTGVTALSGYVNGADGRLYVFSMLSNYSGSTPRPVENTFVVTLANWKRPG
ncbi:MAG TPA: D-alanyl-D-alanine carboxypeptidase/D-alanyl-D-alanine-endopeptidase [Propionibacteriaceae bacterium]